MKALLGVLLLGLAGPLGSAQESAPGGLAIERSVKRTTLDWLGRRTEIQRKEILLVKGSSLAIIDLTFGERLIIRPDLKKVWKADPLAGTYAELGFDELAALRKTAFDEIRAAKARVPGTTDEKELESILEGFDQFAAAPQAELKVTGTQREVIVNGDRVRVSVQVNEQMKAPGWIEALASVGAFHPVVAEKLRGLGGLPTKGTMRYALFLDRIVEQFETTSLQPRDIADAEFELPKGLIRAPLKGLERVPEPQVPKPPVLKREAPSDKKGN